jgi:hypothetical protein
MARSLPGSFFFLVSITAGATRKPVAHCAMANLATLLVRIMIFHG